MSGEGDARFAMLNASATCPWLLPPVAVENEARVFVVSTVLLRKGEAGPEGDLGAYDAVPAIKPGQLFLGQYQS